MKTLEFGSPTYVGDPMNVIRIFNEKEVDELVVLDISGTRSGEAPDLEFIRAIVSEAFMPVAYGGAIRTADQARTILQLGVEKIVLGTIAAEHSHIVQEISSQCGSQSVVVCIDAKQTSGGYEARIRGGTQSTGLTPKELARLMEDRGAGELIIQSIDQDGRMNGYDLSMIRQVADSVRIPVVALGGAGNLGDMVGAIRKGHASAAAAGSMFVFYGRFRAVLIRYPDQDRIQEAFS